MESILRRGRDSIALRLILSGLAVILPVGISTAWLGSAYQKVMWDIDPARTMAGLFIFGFSGVLPTGFIILYPLERWVIADRAVRSLKWTVARLLLYLAAGIPIGWATQVLIRFGVGAYPLIIESIYYLQAILNAVVVALLFSFIERAVEAMRQREARLLRQIEALQIEIDQVRKAQEVAAITGSEYFQAIKEKARDFRRGWQAANEGETGGATQL